MKKINITETILEFSHNITEDKVTIIRVKDDGRTLLKQIEDSLNSQLEEMK